MKRHELTEEQGNKVRELPGNAQWNPVLAEYRDTLEGPAGAVWPLEKCVHPVSPMESARPLGVCF